MTLTLTAEEAADLRAFSIHASRVASILTRDDDLSIEGVIRRALTDGPAPARDLIAECERAGFAERTAQRARHRLGIKSRRYGFGADA